MTEEETVEGIARGIICSFSYSLGLDGLVMGSIERALLTYGDTRAREEREKCVQVSSEVIKGTALHKVIQAIRALPTPSPTQDSPVTPAPPTKKPGLLNHKGGDNNAVK